MTNSKTTKKALLTSTLAVLMCVAMLIGTTFAWFTDSASTAVNKIQAGTLDIALEKLVNDEWVNAEGSALDFIKAADAPADEAVLWEPGCTYSLSDIRIVNNGNLALKYKIAITGINGDAKLNEAIEWTINGVSLDEEGTLLPGEASSTLSISGHMKEEAGNEYQGLSIDGAAITVYAAQYTYEYDSNNNQYDANAEYNENAWTGDIGELPAESAEGVISISTAEEFAAFANEVNVNRNTFAGKKLVLTDDIDLNNLEFAPIGQTPAPHFAGELDGQGHSIKNLKIDDTDVTSATHAVGLFGWLHGTVKNLTIENADVKATMQALSPATMNSALLKTARLRIQKSHQLTMMTMLAAIKQVL